MSKFCGNCGKPVEEGQSFCTNCGAPLNPSQQSAYPNDDKTENNISQTKPGMKTNDSLSSPPKGLILGIAVALIIVCGAGAYYFFSPNEEAKQAVQPAQTETVPAEAEEKPVSVPKDPFEIIQQEFSRRNISGTVMATSYGHNPNGCLVLLGGKGMRIAAWDMKNDRIAFINYTSSNLRSFIENRTNPKDLNPLIFDMTIEDDTHDQDASAGYWSGSDHTIPVYALYELDADKNIVPGMIYTGAGRRPSHYHKYLYEQKNVDMANLVLTESEELHKNAVAHNIRIY